MTQKRLNPNPKNTSVFKRVANWWQDPASNALNKASIIFGIISAIVTTSLAAMAYNAQVEIKGMRQVLGTFKPNVRWLPLKIILSGDTIFVHGENKNYGTRAATDVITYTYFITDPLVYEKPNDTLIDMLPNENYYWDFRFYRERVISDSMVKDFIMATKVVFTDPITKENDSTYSYTTGRPTTTNEIKFYVGKKDDEKNAREFLTNRMHIDW